MADAIFISYRRDDSEGEAGRLFGDLTRAFGKDAVFMDVAGIKPGTDFRKALEENVAHCGVFLAIIGPTWATITNSQGVRRLNDPKDYVAMELSSALSREVPVIPILVHDAKMPDAEQLPDSLKLFAYRNGVEVSHTRWDSDVALLVEALKPYITTPKPGIQPPVHATVPVQLPPPNPPAYRMPPPPSKKSKAPLFLGIAAVVCLVVILLAVIGNLTDKDGGKHVSKSEDSPAQSDSPAAESVVPAAASEAQTKPAIPTGAFSQPVPKATQQNAPQNDDPQPAPPPNETAQLPGLTGRWKNPAQGYTNNSLSRLVISTSGEVTFMHAYGFCQPIECDWGRQRIAFNGSLATAGFRIDPYRDTNGYMTQRVATIAAAPNGYGNLQLAIQNVGQNLAGGPFNNQYTVTFVPDE